ncbi:MAG TPA: hypothetical protein VGD61_10070 [Pyrinomonadaceae bacterium]
MGKTPSNTHVKSIPEQYDAKLSLYSEFTTKIEQLIADILRQNRVNIHSVTSRVKDRVSLAKKLNRPDSKYQDLSEVTDVTGIRITTFFCDDVDRVAEIIEREFQIDQSNSIDKRAVLDPDRFGYLSLHHVVSLSSERCQLVEYQRFGELRCEIQTRSILQHAWAEIEHDLGYKSAASVPNEIRRRFSRLAGLLELADQEFAAIRDELSEYEDTVDEKIRSEPHAVDINKASIQSYIARSEIVKRLDRFIANCNQGSVNQKYRDERPETGIERLAVCGIHSIAALDNALLNNEKLIMAFAEHWLARTKTQMSFAPGVSILYLMFLLVSSTQDTKKINDFLQVAPFKGRSDELVNRLLQTYRAMQTAVG